MSEVSFPLSKPPIVETVLDIDCDLPPDRPLDALEEEARAAFSDRYPVFRKSLFQEHKIEAKPDAAPRHTLRHGLQAFQLLSQDEKQLVQVRVSGFSFNRLAPYTTLDDYLPEIERTWRQFVELTTPVQVRRIGLRTINRIPLPLVEGQVRIENFFTVPPRLPNVEGLALTGFLHQHTALEAATGFLVNMVLTTQPLEKEALPVIFDNGVWAVSSSEPGDWDRIAETILALRGLRNRLFQHTLTESCLKLFQ